MAIPTPERFRIKDLAKRWGMIEDDVLEQIRAGHFKHLIVYKHGLSGGVTAHYFIDHAVAPARDTVSIRPAFQIPYSTARSCHRERSAYIHSIEDFPWPDTESTLYIPREEVEAFEKEHGIHPDRKIPKVKATETVAQPKSDAKPAPTGPPWREIAKTIYKEIANEHKNLSMEGYSEMVHEAMVQRHKAGDASVLQGGLKVPPASTIRRQALTNIRGVRGPKKMLERLR